MTHKQPEQERKESYFLPPANKPIVKRQEVILGAYKGYVPDGMTAEEYLAEKE